jgi:hypothetical protein
VLSATNTGVYRIWQQCPNYWCTRRLEVKNTQLRRHARQASKLARVHIPNPASGIMGDAQPYGLPIQALFRYTPSNSGWQHLKRACTCRPTLEFCTFHPRPAVAQRDMTVDTEASFILRSRVAWNDVSDLTIYLFVLAIVKIKQTIS